MNIHHGFPSKRYARIETSDFPEKFSIISRLKKESFVVGLSGDVLRSSVLPQVQVKVPEGAVSSGTKVTLQASTAILGALFVGQIVLLGQTSHFCTSNCLIVFFPVSFCLLNRGLKVVGNH